MKAFILLFGLVPFFFPLQFLSAQEQPTSALDQKIQAYFQDIYSKNLQSVYVRCHPLGSKFGKPTAVTVTGVDITQWKNGVPTGQGLDVVQFTVDYTILWKSFLHPMGGGYTEARSTYAVSDSEVTPVGNVILKTNEKHLKPGQSVNILELGHIAKLVLLVIH